ncbi:hypothetical protein AB0I16_33215 [Streptomyces sp. NPDC050703]|uniref:hypothetical protein n=1 Tax=Streptomyces sp. NPDC050703 TaxID=3157218 RepID=UPI003444330F
MSSFAWFQDGVGYGAAELADWQDRVFVRGGMRHVFRTATEFLANSNQTARTVSIGAGSVFIGHPTGGGTWGWSSGETVAVPMPSNDNPRKDLVVAKLTTAASGGFNGLAIEVVKGVAAASPQVPQRPDNAAALLILDVPKATTTFTLTTVRTTGQYPDQAAFANGTTAIDWAGVLPSPAAFPVGFTLFDYGTNQTWTRAKSGDWFTTDPGPWQECRLVPVQAKSGVAVGVTGKLYVREDSTKWELSGQLSFSPATQMGQLVNPAMLPTFGVSRPTQNTYGATGQTYDAASGGVGRIALMTSGAIEFGGVDTVGNVYVNEQFSKSPWNT